jgi:hypothetical protein
MEQGASGALDRKAPDRQPGRAEGVTVGHRGAVGVTDEVTRRSGEVLGVATVGQSGQGGERREKGVVGRGGV